MASDAPGVRVDAPARLQMGLIDLRGDLGRLFGGLGVALREPRTAVRVEPAAALEASGPDASRAEEFARRFLARQPVAGGARIHVERAIPAHVGLGSGTQLALAVATGLADLAGLPQDVGLLAAAMGRGVRSAVGTWTFARGGLVVDGGRRLDGPGPSSGSGRAARLRASAWSDRAGPHPAGPHPPGPRLVGPRLVAQPSGAPAPLIARYRMPARWRCVVVTPRVRGGLSGEDERAAFERLPAPPAEVVGRISRLLVMGVLPALVEADLVGFGRSVAALQRLVGECFAPVQGSVYAGPEVAEIMRLLAEHGGVGAGQSSWGPTAYAFVDGAARADELAGKAREWAGTGGVAFATAFDNRGARVTAIHGEPRPQAGS